MKRRKLNLKAKFEGGSSCFKFQVLRSRRFQRGFDGVKLHRPTSMVALMVVETVRGPGCSGAS